jgi:hypothetical protein
VRSDLKEVETENHAPTIRAETIRAETMNVGKTRDVAKEGVLNLDALILAAQIVENQINDVRREEELIQNVVILNATIVRILRNISTQLPDVTLLSRRFVPGYRQKNCWLLQA